MLHCSIDILIIRKKLKDKEYKFTINEILNTFKNMNVINVKDRFYQSTYLGSNVLNALCDVFKLSLDKKNYLSKNLNNFLKK